MCSRVPVAINTLAPGFYQVETALIFRLSLEIGRFVLIKANRTGVVQAPV